MKQVRKDLRNKDYSQEQILNMLQQEKTVDPAQPRTHLTKKHYVYVKSLVTLLGIKAEQEGNLHKDAYNVFNTMPTDLLKYCTKAMRRTWLLDKEFCTRYVPAKVYALPYEEVIKAQDSRNKIRLNNKMIQSDISAEWCERDAQLSEKSRFHFPLAYHAIRSSKGQLLDRFDKRCTLDDAGYIEVLQLKKLNWQELFLLHQLALIDQQKIKAGADITAQSAQLLAQYKGVENKYKKHIEKISFWKSLGRSKKTFFELRLQEIENFELELQEEA
jgi:hypothetical protein